MPEVTHPPMPSMTDEEGCLNYSVYIHSPPEGLSFKSGSLQVSGDVSRKRQSTPVKIVKSAKLDKQDTATKTSLSSAACIKIKTEVEVHEEDKGSTSCPTKPTP